MKKYVVPVVVGLALAYIVGIRNIAIGVGSAVGFAFVVVFGAIGIIRFMDRR